MEVAALLADGLRDLRHEGDDVVVGRLLDFGDAIDIDSGARLDRPDGLRGDHATAHFGAGDGDLDAQHPLEMRLLGPDGTHLR